MKTFSTLLFFAVSCLFSVAHSDTFQEIELIDGSIVRAIVVSMNRGVYRLRSETLGEIEIPAQRIKAIRSREAQEDSSQTTAEPESPLPAATADPLPPAEPPAADDLQQSLLQDPTAMEKILSLQDDPLVQSILSDEDTMQAIQAGDLGTLLSDPKIRALMQHPTIQDLGRTHGR